MSDFDILNAASSGMQAQRAAMDVEARNVALAQIGDGRHPARAFVPQFATALATPGDGASPEVDLASLDRRLDDPFANAAAPDGDDGPGNGVVAFTGVRRSDAPVDSIGEMVNVLDAQRAYEADASVFDVGKRLFERTIEMGRV